MLERNLVAFLLALLRERCDSGGRSRPSYPATILLLARVADQTRYLIVYKRSRVYLQCAWTVGSEDRLSISAKLRRNRDGKPADGEFDLTHTACLPSRSSRFASTTFVLVLYPARQLLIEQDSSGNATALLSRRVVDSFPRIHRPQGRQDSKNQRVSGPRYRRPELTKVYSDGLTVRRHLADGLFWGTRSCAKT
jgi:hypothetical protein